MTSDRAKLDSACAKAMELQLAGQLELAGQLYRAILQAEPKHAAAHYCIGMLEVQSQRPLEGLPHLLAALEAKPETSEYWLGYLEALLLAGRIDEARSTLAIGSQHGLAGKAVQDFATRLERQTSRAVSSGPPPRVAPHEPGTPNESSTPGTSSTPPTPNTPGMPGRAQRRSEAAHLRKQERALNSLIKHRKFSEALSLARGMCVRFPDCGLAWKVQGAFIAAERRYQEALVPLQTAARLLPSDAEAHVNLGLNLVNLDRLDEAESHLKRAIELEPELASAHFRLAMAYGLRNRYAEAEACLRRGMSLNADYVAGDGELSFSSFLFIVSHNPGVGAEELFDMHCRVGAFLEGKLRGSWPQHANRRDPDRCLKIGFVSGDLYHHAVAVFIEPVLEHLCRRANLELHAYYNNVVEDAVTQRLRGYFAGWHPISTLNDAATAGAIMEDGIDILIDLSGHSASNRLPVFARKPAPIQVSWIGYPGTTGLRAMDYYLADRYFLPPGSFDRYFTEKIVYLPANVPFRPFQSAPDVGPLPALETGCLRFASFNRLGKINAVTVDMWCALLNALPESRMLIGAIESEGQRTALVDQFRARGVAAERVAFHPRCSMEAYLSLHHQVDICLDAYPYTGGTTTIQALWMGVPTLTVAGPTPAARQGAAILGQLGLAEFIAADAADLVAKGRYWAAHLEELAGVRAGLRERWRQSAVRRPDLIAAELDRTLRRMWTRWCSGLLAESF
jgi:predicted O-linked N-acetylglucosamine transferase (SPINDLY family)